MAIVRWDPFDLNRLFRRGWIVPGDEALFAEGGTWAPAVDIYETEDSITVEAELPGVDPKDIDVSIDEGVLKLKGERTVEKEVKEENYHRVERAHGLFRRSIRLPAEVDEDKVKAGYEKGVLKVTIPKVEQKKPKSIPIKVEAKKEKK